MAPSSVPLSIVVFEGLILGRRGFWAEKSPGKTASFYSVFVPYISTSLHAHAYTCMNTHTTLTQKSIVSTGSAAALGLHLAATGRMVVTCVAQVQ